MAVNEAGSGNYQYRWSWDKDKIMIGGGQINDEIRKYAGADAYGKDAMDGVALAKQWLGSTK